MRVRICKVVGFLVGWVLALAISGCSVVAVERSTDPVNKDYPSGWSVNPAGELGVDQNWIARFKDRQLAILVAEAMNQNPDLRATAERVLRAEAVARLAGARKKPQVSGQISGLQQKQRFPGFPIKLGSNTAESYGASLDINWEPDLWGRMRASQRAEVAESMAQSQDYRAARASLAGQLAKAWFVLGEAMEQIMLAEAAIEVRVKTVASIRERFAAALEGGLASQLRLAETDLASSRASLARWQAERAQAQRQIELLVGRFPAGMVAQPRGLPTAPPVPPSGLPSELLQRRPDIIAARQRYTAAGNRKSAARAARFPSFSLTGRAGTSTGALEEVLDSGFGIWSVAGSVVQPLIGGGRLRVEERIAGHDEIIALRELQGTILRAFAEVEQALVAEEFYAKREAAVADSARLAREAAEASILDFADGAVDALTLLAAQDRKVQTAFQLVSLRRIRLENRINLHLALGGDFQFRASR
ncbi:MAG: efflux transporter outer membrane subunit [Roseibacillus sp.]|nr:efflux transporter outer membrane subunit [Roseibacillus sp.]